MKNQTAANFCISKAETGRGLHCAACHGEGLDGYSENWVGKVEPAAYGLIRHGLRRATFPRGEGFAAAIA